MKLFKNQGIHDFQGQFKSEQIIIIQVILSFP